VSRPFVIGIILVAIVVIGVIVWFGSSSHTERPAAPAAPTQDFDTSDGQQMRPRWNQ